MTTVVQFSHFGGPEVLELVAVERPVPGPGQVLVRMRAAGLNPGETKIRQGLLEAQFPTSFPSGEGSDLAGVVEEVGPSVSEVMAGDEVAGFSDRRASHAELVLVEKGNLTPKPPPVPWEVAGSLFVAGSTATAAVRAVRPGPGDTVVVSGAAGGVGGAAAQLAVLAGARVVGIARVSAHTWLSAHGITPLDSEGDLAQRLRSAAPKVDALIDTIGGGYVRLAVESGVAPDRIDTIVDFPAVQEFGVKAEGSAAASTAPVLAHLLDLIARGELAFPVARSFPLREVAEAYRFMEGPHGQGKVVLTN